MADPNSINPAQRSVPSIQFLWLEITPRCNLECIHCYADSGPRRELTGRMSLMDWKRTLQEAANLGCRQVQFIGGEPTLHPNLPELISCAKEYGYQCIEIFTNATRISAALQTSILCANASIATSFYSDRADVHDHITRRQGSFERTVRSIKRLTEAGVTVRAGVVETAANFGHSVPASEFLQTIGVTDISVDSSREVGRGASISTPIDPFDSLCGQCWSGRLCVTSSGRVYPCVFSRFVDLGCVFDGVEAILNSAAMREFHQLHRKFSGTQSNCDPVKCTPTCSPAYQFCLPSMSPLRCAPASDAPEPKPKNP